MSLRKETENPKTSPKKKPPNKLPIKAPTLPILPEKSIEEDEQIIHIEEHMRSAYADEGECVHFEVRTSGDNPNCIWYHNGCEVRYNPRYKATNRGSWHLLLIKDLKRIDAGVYTVVCRNNTSYAESHGLLTITNKRPIELNYKKHYTIVYLPLPKSNIKITKHLTTLRVCPGEPITMRVEVDKGEDNISLDFVWFKNNRFSVYDDGVQLVGNNYEFAEYTKYSSDEADSGIYTVLVIFKDVVLSSSASVVVMDPHEGNYPVFNHGSPSFCRYLPNELEVFEKENLVLNCKATFNAHTTVRWQMNINEIQADDNTVMETLENGGISLKIFNVNNGHAGIYTVLVKDTLLQCEISSQCVVRVIRRPPVELPAIEVQYPLNVVISSVGAKVCLYCKFNYIQNDILFVVWRVGQFVVERDTTLFGVTTNNLGMNLLLIRRVDPDMLGEVACELHYMLPSGRSLLVAVTKGLLIHAPPETMTEDSCGEYSIFSKKSYADIRNENTTVNYTAAKPLPGRGPDGKISYCPLPERKRQDEAAAYPEEDSDSESEEHSYDSWFRESNDSSSDDDTLGSIAVPRIRTFKCKISENYDVYLMEFVYCRLKKDLSHFLLIQNCRPHKMDIMAETSTGVDRFCPPGFINILWINKKGLPPNTLYAVDIFQPSNSYYQAGVSSESQLIISPPNAVNLMMVRVRIIYTAEEAPQATFIVCPPRQTDSLPRIIERRPKEEYAKQYTKIGDLVGNGAYGAVYMVKDKNGDYYAAKVVKTRTEKRREAVRREVDIMERLQHDRIVQLHKAFLSRDQCVFIMEYLWGGELFERIIEEDNFKERTAVHYLTQIIEGLAYLHGQRIVHLDIKPENLVCASRNSRDIKIIDFGLSRVLENKVLRVIYGTRDYIAPEVLNFEGVRTASDMWSLGVVTYVMLSGTAPFVGDNWFERAANITRGAYTFDDPAFDNVTTDAKNFINDLLLVKPEDRLTAVTARTHPWMRERPRVEIGLTQTKRWKSNLKTYLQTNKDRWQVERIYYSEDFELKLGHSGFLGMLEHCVCFKCGSIRKIPTVWLLDVLTSNLVHFKLYRKYYS